MGIELVADINNIEEITERIEQLKRSNVDVGVLAPAGSTMLKIANAHEYGATITPKNSEYLTIPLSRKYKDKSARSISGLFVIKSKNGNLFLVKKKGRDKLEFCYILKKKVEIPERSFIRSFVDERLNEVEQFLEELMARLVNLEVDLNNFLDLLGEYCSGKVKEHMTDISDPSNSALTVALKGSSNPLIDTGHLRDSITHEVR